MALDQFKPDVQSSHSFSATPDGQGKSGLVGGAGSAIDVQLGEANRTKPGTERLRIANEIMEASKEYQKLVSEGQQILEKVNRLDAEVELKHLEAQRELEHARCVKAEADTYYEKVITGVKQQIQEMMEHARSIKADAITYLEQHLSDVRKQAQQEHDQALTSRVEADAYREQGIAQAWQQAQHIIGHARSIAEQEGNETKQKCIFEAQQMLAQAGLIKSAAQKDADGARLGAESQRVSAQAEAELDQGSAAKEIFQADSPGTPEESGRDRHLASNESVLGVNLGGSSKVYPLRSISSQKVINDSVGAIEVLVTFEPSFETGMIFRREVEGRPLTFHILPDAQNTMTMMMDQETGTIWEVLTGRATSGPLIGTVLQRLDSEYSFWFAWIDLHPDAEFYIPTWKNSLADPFQHQV